MTSHNFLRDQRGAATLEFMLIASALFTLLFAVAGFGDVTQRNIRLQSAVRAGGEYARFFPTDTTGIQNAVANALPSGTLSGTPTVTCYCNVAGVSTSTSCSAIATGTTCNFPFFVKVSASMPASAITTPYWSGSFNNTASHEVRIQ
jgi:Flp pilus assembly protein TadG